MSDFQLRYKTATTIEFYPECGRADSATVTGYLGGAEGAGNATLWDEANITLDTASSTISSASQGDMTLTVDDTTGFVAGRRYWVVPTGEEGFEVRVRGVIGDQSLKLYSPLRQAISSGVISSHRLTFPITTTHTDSVRRLCRVEWAVTIGADVFYFSQIFDIVLVPWELNISEEDIESIYPPFGELAGYDPSWEKLVIGAEQWVRNELVGSQQRPDLAMEREILKTAAIYEALYKWTQISPKTNDSLAKYFSSERDRAMENYFNSKGWYDSDQDAAAGLMGGFSYILIDGEPYIIDQYEDGTSELGSPPSYYPVG